MKGFKPLLPIIGLFFLVGSCKTSSNSDIEVIEGEITSISCPTSAISSNDVKIEVVFSAKNSCSTSYNIKATKVGQTIRLRAYFSIPKGIQVCNNNNTSHKLTYIYFPDLPGNYFFQSGQNRLIADTLVVY